MKKKQKQSGFMVKIIAPVVVILIIVGFIYWGGEQSTSDNPVAKGVAKFYAEVRRAVKPGSSRLDDYTIELPEQVRTVTEQLEVRGDTVQPGSTSWQGQTKKRSFKENDTMMTALQNFAREEGVEVIWDLKYDYIVKQHFSERGNLKSLVDKVSRVVATDYSGKVDSFYCPKEKALVITAEPESYLFDFCVTTKSTRRQIIERQREKEYKESREALEY